LEYSARPWNPAGFQKRGAKFLIEHAGAGLLLDPGMRKTSIALAAFKMLKERFGVADRALVVAPMRVAELTWPAEIAKWKDFEHLRYAILHGNKKVEALRNDVDFYFINPEGLEWLLTNPVRKTRLVTHEDGTKEVVDYIDHVPTMDRFKLLDVDTLIVDESTKFKNTASQRFHYLKPFLGRFGRRWILTGTPAPNGLMDLFGQIYICDQGYALGRYITHYRKTFFEPCGFGGYSYRLKDGADQKIYKAVKPFTMRLDAKDYLELPTLVPNYIQVELPPKARKAYNEMEEEMFTILDSKALTAVSAGTASMKCEQIASGAIYTDPKRNKTVVAHDEKLTAMEDLIEQRQGKPTLLLYWFNHEADALIKRLGKDGGWMGRGQSMKREKEVLAAWTRGDLPWMLGQPQSISHGLNLQEGPCDALCWYTLTWDLELFEQTWRRLVRSGSQHKTVVNHMIIARNTVDEAKLIALDFKKRTQNALLDALKRYRKGERSANIHS